MFLYYTRSVDPTMMHALNDLATEITRGDDDTIKAMKISLDHCHTYPDAIIKYSTIDITLGFIQIQDIIIHEMYKVEKEDISTYQKCHMNHINLMDQYYQLLK